MMDINFISISDMITSTRVKFNQTASSFRAMPLLFSRLSMLNPSKSIAMAIFEINVKSKAPAENIMTAVRISVSEGT